MKWALVLIISTFALNSAHSFALDRQVLLPVFCSQEKSRVLDPALQDLFDRYPDVESRSKNPEGYIADLDKVIARMPYGGILNCRSKLPYQVSFLPAQQGGPGTFLAIKHASDGSASVVMNFNLATPTPGAVFNYIHELDHVCQTYNTQEQIKYLYQEYAKLTPREKLYYSSRPEAKTMGTPNAEFQIIWDDSRRLKFLNEIDAFHFQFLRFRQTLESGSPGLCESTNLWTYIAMEKDLMMGHFAQNIMSSYMQGIDDNDPAFFVSDSPLVSYYDQGAKSAYQMRELNSAMVQAISLLGIHYQHPHQENGRLR